MPAVDVGYSGDVELFFTGLLVAVSVLILWFSVYVVYKLFKGQD